MILSLFNAYSLFIMPHQYHATSLKTWVIIVMSTSWPLATAQLKTFIDLYQVDIRDHRFSDGP